MAEFIGTFTLVLLGCGAAVIAGADGTTGKGLAGISFAFGLALIGMAPFRAATSTPLCPWVRLLLVV